MALFCPDFLCLDIGFVSAIPVSLLVGIRSHANFEDYNHFVWPFWKTPGSGFARGFKGRSGHAFFSMMALGWKAYSAQEPA
jgi:hypothetical protein